MPCTKVLRKVLLIAVLVLPAVAQFTHLSATDDGRYLYFTSRLVLKNGGLPTAAQSRLYRLGPGEIVMFAAVGSFGAPGRWTNTVRMAYVSGDGRSVGVTVQGPCAGVRACGKLMAREAENRELGPGTLYLSRSGEWALLAPDNPLSDATLIEVGTGQRTTVPQLDVRATSPLASDGSVIVTSGRGSISVSEPAGVWKRGKFTPFAPYQSLMIEPFALSDDASTLLFESARPPRQLIARDLTSARNTVLYTLAAQMTPVILGLSNDGQHVLFRVGGDAAAEGVAYLSDVSTGKTEPVRLEEGELVSDGTLSGSGNSAFVVTTAGRLVKITLPTGAMDTLIPPTPSASNFEYWAFGSLFHMKGTFTGPASDWKSRILIGGQAAPVLSVKPGLLDIQIPWLAAAGSIPFRILDTGASPFEENELVRTSQYAISLEKAGPGEPSFLGLKASNGEGNGPPPTKPGPGDTFRLYMTGLGPVTNPPQTGAPTPVSVPSPIRARLSCNFSPYPNPVETVSASLVPGMIGVYQATFRMPDNAATATPTGVSCDLCAPCDPRSNLQFHGQCGDACAVGFAATPSAFGLGPAH